MPPSVTEATGRAAGNVAAEYDYEAQDFKEIEAGELRAELLQAITRGCLRICEGNQARAAEVHLWSDYRADLVQWLPDLFPGATILLEGREMEVGEAVASPAVERVWTVLEDHFKVSQQPLPFPEVYGPAGVRQNHFGRSILNHKEFRRRMDEAGLIVTGRRPKVFARVADSFG